MLNLYYFLCLFSTFICFCAGIHILNVFLKVGKFRSFAVVFTILFIFLNGFDFIRTIQILQHSYYNTNIFTYGNFGWFVFRNSFAIYYLKEVIRHGRKIYKLTKKRIERENIAIIQTALASPVDR